MKKELKDHQYRRNTAN